MLIVFVKPIQRFTMVRKGAKVWGTLQEVAL